ncbi:HEAT repeat domain-containing protein [Nostoc sp. ChiQUE01b]|uniref:HEAT repeat domain-containing protein n=1 Tax=Nostoc sp. ChiQUE01b TaxID=3075376 RepID=UPI002AD2E77F|nr:HEAT repeat domain-containing protein [Nostoc sp. ChiQUE01b]MDZ8259203.1 HEAT repeat domain-containing protein [Nostoc sp. ChiQUE01b]
MPLGLVERKKPSKPQADISPEQGSELYKETEITKTFEHDAFLEEVLKQKNTPKSKGKRIAIIGEPGAGKTTLLQQIADWVSREIHQSIVIWVSLADLREKELKSYLFETWLTQVAEKTGKAEPTEQLKNDLVVLFNQNNIWLLLDGLDEMSASSGNPLTEIARQFREVRLISQPRIVLTCRVNLWDGSTNALNDFDTYRSLDFSYPQQVERFIHKWFAANREKGEQLCTALKESGKERIQDLVKNPLRLTLLCLNWQSGEGKLPDTQAGLYQQFVDDFNKWKKEEFTTTSEQRQQLNIKLGELAKEAIDKQATRFRLRQDFVSQFLGDVDDENSLLKLALNRGWLNCVGIDTNRKPVYAFFHASFQEYFAAKAIDDWHFFLNHVPKNPSQGTYRIFEPQWRQTMLLWLGREEENLKQQKQEFIDALVNFKDGCQKFYEYRAYFLAAAGIAEFRDYFRADEIITQIAANWTYSSVFLKKEDEAMSALQQTDRKKAIAALVQLLQSTNLNNNTRWVAASSLGKIGTGNEIAITVLVQLLQSTNLDDYTYRQAASSLGEIGTGNEIAIAALVQLLQSTNLDDYTYRQAAKSLGEIGTGNEIAIVALVQLLQSINLDDDTRRDAAYSLGKIDPGNEIALAALVQLLQSTNLDDDTRRDAAYSLGEISTGNEIALAALVQLLQSTNLDDYTRWRAASSLGKIDPGNESAIIALVQLLQSTTLDNDIRGHVASSLGEIGTGNESAIIALVQLLQSTNLDHYTRRQVVDSLREIDPGNEIAIAALVQLLQSTNLDDYTRRQAAESLGKIGTGNEIAIAALVQLLQSTNLDDYTRWLAAKSLGEIGTGNKIAIAALVQLLQSTNLDDYTRRQAAESLGKIGTGNEIAIAALVQLLQSTTVDDYTRWQASESLGKIDSGNEIAIAVLVQLLQSTIVDDFIRGHIGKSLEEIGTGNEIVIAALVQLLQSTNLDDSTLMYVAESLGKIDSGNEIAIAALVQLLQSTNLDDDTRWQAAESLGEIDPSNEFVIAALVQLLQSTTVDDYTRRQAAESLGEILQVNKHRFEVVKALSGYWQLNGEYYDLAWKCAQNMPYLDFYQAWHQHNVVTRTMRSLKRILFTRII